MKHVCKFFSLLSLGICNCQYFFFIIYLCSPSPNFFFLMIILVCRFLIFIFSFGVNCSMKQFTFIMFAVSLQILLSFGCCFFFCVFVPEYPCYSKCFSFSYPFVCLSHHLKSQTNRR